MITHDKSPETVKNHLYFVIYCRRFPSSLVIGGASGGVYQEGSMISAIGIKIADGKFYPVVKEKSGETKRLVLTTARDNQEKLHIDLYRCLSGKMSDALYIGSMVVKNLRPRLKGEASIELIITSTEDGDIVASAADTDTSYAKERQNLAVSLEFMEENRRIYERNFGRGNDSCPPPGLLVPQKEKRGIPKKALFFTAAALTVIGFTARMILFAGGDTGLSALESLPPPAEAAPEIAAPPNPPDPAPPEPEDTSPLSVMLLNRVEGEDVILNAYLDTEFSGTVIKFFEDITGSKKVTEAILSHAVMSDIPPALAFALCETESSYTPRAVNRSNLNGTVDRGLFQLNSATFPDLEVDDFFDINENARQGLSHLRWCLDTAGTEVAALALYNTGFGNVDSARTGLPTLNYISRILKRQRGIEERFIIEYGDIVRAMLAEVDASQ